MIILLLLLVPVAEIAVFVQVGSRIGAGMTVMLVVLSAVAGIWLVRLQGFATAARVQAMLARGESPALGMLEGLALLVAGVLLIIPGFLTDIAAFILLIPPLRRWIIRFYLRRVRRDTGVAYSGPPDSPGKTGSGRPPLEGESHRED
jgi:UPF0716 protein FxsA